MGRVAVPAVALLCLMISLLVFNFHGVEGRSLLFVPPYVNEPPCYGNPGEVPYSPGLTEYNCFPEPLTRSARVHIPPLCHGSPGDLPGVNCLIGPGPVSRSARVHNPPLCHGSPSDLPGVNCLIGPGPVSRSAQVDHLPLCHGSPSDLPGVNCLIGPGPVSRITAQDDPDCVPRRGVLPPLKCQKPSPLAAAYVTQTSPPADTKPHSYGLAAAKVFEACTYTWQLPGTDCWPPIGASPHCDHPHDTGCAPTPPSSTGVDGEVPWH